MSADLKEEIQRLDIAIDKAEKVLKQEYPNVSADVAVPGHGKLRWNHVSGKLEMGGKSWKHAFLRRKLEASKYLPALADALDTGTVNTRDAIEEAIETVERFVKEGK